MSSKTHTIKKGKVPSVHLRGFENWKYISPVHKSQILDTKTHWTFFDTVCILMARVEITKEVTGVKTTPTRLAGAWWMQRGRVWTAASSQWRLDDSSPCTGWTDPNSERPPLGLSLMIIHLLHNQTLQLSTHTNTLWSAPPLPPLPRAAALSSSWAPRAARWSASLLCHLTHWTPDTARQQLRGGCPEPTFQKRTTVCDAWSRHTPFTFPYLAESSQEHRVG